jgi:putative NADH-flavin reductase
VKLIVFGATGGVGQQLVSQALAQGHTVTAFARRAEAVTTKHAGLVVVQGDVLNKGAVTQAVAGHEVVLSALGTRGGEVTPALIEGTRHIIDAVTRHGVSRSLWVSSFGVGESMAQMGWFARSVFVPLFLKRALEEKEVQERIIVESDTEWIIARPGGLTDGPLTGVYQCVRSDARISVGRPEISRADVADFLLKNLADTKHLCQAVGLTY